MTLALRRTRGGLAALLSGVLLSGVALAAPASASTATTTSLAAVTATAGVPVTLTATVSPRPTGGTVAFIVGGSTLRGCGAAAVSTSTGRALCRTTFATAGTRTVTVRYSGHSPYAASTGSRSITTVVHVVGGVGSCTTSTGALVGVDFGHWRGPLVRGCGTSLTTGRGLLTSAGFHFTNVTRFPAFICRLGHPLFASGAQYPTTAQDSCYNTPPASAYWSFWTAAKGVNTWSYSPVGADSDKPANGEVEAWTFGSTDISGTTNKPIFTPAQVRAGLPTTATATRAPAARRAATSPAKADVAKAVAYLQSQLVDGNHLEPFGPGFADIGLTIDAALALAADRHDDATLGKITDYVRTNQNEYTTLSGPFARFASGGAVGKVALLSEATGGNPRAFGGVDLVAALRKLTCTGVKAANQCAGKGNYAFTSSTFSQAVAVLAQLRAGDTSGAAAPVAFLEGLQNANGGFPSLIPGAGQPSDTDSTAEAAMTLALVPGSKARTALGRALAWLAARQTASGGFPGTAGESVNSAGLAAQALRLEAHTYASRLTKVQAFLAARQNSDGGFDIATGVEGSDSRASVQALSGVLGTPTGSVLDDLGAKQAAGSGASYLVGQLTGGDHYTSSFGGSTYDDQGLTADGVFALLSAGGQDAAVGRMVRYLEGQVDAYADTSGMFGGPYSGALAKLALVAESTGHDPHAFGGADLLTVLADHVCTTTTTTGTCSAPGDFVSSYATVSQALGVLALQSSPTASDHLTVTSPPVKRLLQLQCADGGFSSDLIAPGKPCTSEVDTTGYAVQALAAVASTDAQLAKAQAYLQKAQHANGLFPGAAGENSNSTALAAQALQTLVTALVADTPNAPGPKAVTPVVTWQSALRGLRTLTNPDGGFGRTAGDTSDVRASTQAVAAVGQRTLLELSGAVIRSAPRLAAVPTPGGGTSSTPVAPSSSATHTAVPSSSTPVTTASSAASHAPAADGSATPVGAPADTGARPGPLLGYALALLLAGLVLALAGRRRVAVVGPRHRRTAPTHRR